MGLIPELNDPARPWLRVVQRLLPPGPIWDLSTQPELEAAARAMVGEVAAGHNAIRLLVAQAFPSTITYLLDDWIADLDLPWPCGSLPATDAGKRAAIAGRLAAQGGQTPAYYVAVAEAAGVAINIVERPKGQPFRLGLSRLGIDRFGSEAQLHEWEVQSPASTPSETRSLLECLINAFKPAHTVVIYTYTL
jgi:uncharacterized protein YmfQ (DUF2313 family)